VPLNIQLRAWSEKNLFVRRAISVKYWTGKYLNHIEQTGQIPVSWQVSSNKQQAEMLVRAATIRVRQPQQRARVYIRPLAVADGRWMGITDDTEIVLVLYSGPA
jgi:hypothetical protein